MMAASLDLHSLEQYCETLYNPSSQASRIQVESLLNYHFPTFSLATASSATTSSTSAAVAAAAQAQSVAGAGSDLKGHSPSINTPIESALFCRSLLENTQNPYALMQVVFLFHIFLLVTEEEDGQV
jgi:exportin-7